MKTLGTILLLITAPITVTQAAGAKVLTFDALPTDSTFRRYTEDGITLSGTDRTNVFLTKLNSRNGTTAAQLVSSNGGVYILSLGGRFFSLRSINVITGSCQISSGFGFATITNGTNGPFPSTFTNVTQIMFRVGGSAVTVDDITLVPSETPGFVNWETSPLHPVALSPDGAKLAVCNLPDNRLELFDVTSGVPVSIGSVPVGLDPISVRWRTSDEAWVVNHISDSVSIVDTSARRAIATIDTMDTPADVLFAGAPQRAFVSCSMPNTIQVFDPATRALVASVPIDAERPKAMAASADGSKVYVAIFESGNASTILAREITTGIGSNVVNYPGGPYGGLNPPPNSGNNFNPPINPSIPATFPPPKVSHIVKKNPSGRWMDDNNRDWTEFVSGTNAGLSGRRVGWDLPDRDLAIIETTNLTVSYVSGLMNICMDVAVNPASGLIAVVGIDGRNEIRFEPNLNGTFLRVETALVDPSTLNKTVKDLNPHLDYITRTLPESERNKSLGDPRGIVWNSNGTRAYITGMGSDNLVIVDASGNRVGATPISLGEGPTGVALDEPRQRLYVLNRFSATVSVVDTVSQAVAATVRLFDPTPAAVRNGRRHLYNTHTTSGLGYVACASCHVDARMDRLAWDLGDPAGLVVRITNSPTAAFDFHPMKGPTVTITFQDMIGHEPLHWRGDRRSLEEFNQTFTNLQSAATALTSNEMKDFKAFLATIHFPPNPFRNFDNTFSTNLPLPGHKAIGSGALPAGTPLPNGNADNGATRFGRGQTGGCFECHTLPSGLGPTTSLPQGSNGENHLVLFEHGRLGGVRLKPAQLRSVREKIGFDFDSTNSRAGFGFTHTGNGDTMTRFLQNGFSFIRFDDQLAADFIAFLLSFSGSDVVRGTDNIFFTLGVPSKDVPAAVGKQITIQSTAPAPRVDEMLALANSLTSRVELVVRGPKDGLDRGWLYLSGTGQFQSDRQAETISPNDLRMLANTSLLTYTIVPEGSGRRIALDRDGDGFLDRDELDFPSDPANPASIPLHTRAMIVLSSNLATISWNSVTGKTYQLQFNNSLGISGWSNLTSEITAISSNTFLIDPGNISNFLERYYRIQIVK